ncbi:MAG: AAA domain-containing protein [Bacteroidota bacterium]
MNKQLFQQLQADRTDSLRLLQKASMRGIRDSIVEKYSEQAHFIYELLQNADDVNATKVRFRLQAEGLYFIHNGTKHFTITPPNSIPTGDVNAITSIGFSSKRQDEFKIGKFGVGFKSVFQYTSTPHIYDPNMAFRIRDFIVPEWLEEKDHPVKKAEETLFFFPFDHPKKTAEQSEKEIRNRLSKLQFPLLFLNHLKKIKWDSGEAAGSYVLEIVKQKTIQGIDYQKLTSLIKKGEQTTEQQFIKLSKQSHQQNLPISLVFSLHEENQFQNQETFPAFCFFQTRIQSPFHFLLHAPFLLTDSREGIQLEHEWNISLVEQLADLLCDGFEVLKATNYLNTSFFEVLTMASKAFKGEEGQFFRPFLQKLLLFFQQTKAAIFPTEHGFINLENAYLAAGPSLKDFFPTASLQTLTRNEQANWVFPNLKLQTPFGEFFKQFLQEQARSRSVFKHIFTWEEIIGLVKEDFIKQQSDKWLIMIYEEWYQQYRSLWSKLKYLPIIRTEKGEILPPFDHGSHKPNVFLPSQFSSNYPIVKSTLLVSENTHKFLESLGLTTPDLREELLHQVLPALENKQLEATPETLEKIITHYFQCNAEEAELLGERLKNLPILLVIEGESGAIKTAKPQDVYWLNDFLQEWFEHKTDVLWLGLDALYPNLAKQFSKARLARFFDAINVATEPKILPIEDSLSEEEKRRLLKIQTPQASYAMWEEIEDFELDGLASLLENITIPKAFFLKNYLEQLLEQNPPTKGIYRYEWQQTHEQKMDAHWVRLLKSSAWLPIDNEQFASATTTFSHQLHADFTLSFALKDLLFQEAESTRLSNLTEEEKRAMSLGQSLLQTGLTLEEIQRFQAWKKRKAEKQEKRKERQPKIIPKTEEKDEDEFNPAFLSSEELLAKQEEIRKKLEGELQEQIAELMELEQLKAIIQEATPYTFVWYKALLDLELLLSLEQVEKDKSLSIWFEKVEREKGTSKTLWLRRPKGYLPQRIENMGDMTIKVQLEDEKRTFDIEVVSIRDYALRAKLKSPEQIEGIDFKQVRGATLEIQNTIFTLEALIAAFKELPFQEEDSLQELLPKSIKFIFGPPGTGKTTYLSSKEIMPLLLGEEDLKVLVLTPTNKSADVLTKKILSLFPEPPTWLFRFGNSGDNIVENAGLLRDNSFDLMSNNRYCVITTATRFPYDGFNNSWEEAQLKNIDWDVIIVDEASMISLGMITYILHQCPDTEFIIAGDPFQIEPIVHAEEWKGQNVYTLVNLQSFDPEEQQKQLVPHIYKVENLLTQYRSITTLGYIFSHLAYGGRLQHHRPTDSQRPLQLDKLPLKHANIIRFPVHPLETLYRPQNLKNSRYHIYSAILTTELAKYIASQIQKKEQENWVIGIICPYKAQVMLVEKMLNAQNVYFPKAKIFCGTIHSFQGDECDIIINLYNPPMPISKSPNMFLNRQNILNVAVSRAKDYLILLLPDENTDRRENLYQIKRLEGIIQYYLAGVRGQWKSYDIEEIIFGQPDYIEQNTFATTHQSINVYTEPEKRFEVRCEEQAIDVQIGYEITSKTSK